MTRGIADKGATIRLPVHMAEFGSRVESERARLKEQLDRLPTDLEIAAALGEDPDKVALYTRMTRPLFSLNAPAIAVDGDDPEDLEPDEFGAAAQTVVEFGDLIEDEYDLIETAIAQQMMSAQVEAVLERLSEREAGVLRMRFGFGDGVAKTLDEIGTVLGVTRERVRQIEAKALKRLRTPAVMEALGLVPPPISAATTAAGGPDTSPNPNESDVDLGSGEDAPGIGADAIQALLRAYGQLRHVRSAASLASIEDRVAATVLTYLLLWERGLIDDANAAPNHGAPWDPADIDRVTAAHIAGVPLEVIADSVGRTQLAVAWRLLDNTASPVMIPPELDDRDAIFATWAEIGRRVRTEAQSA